MKGPERSTTSEVTTTTVAVRVIFNASSSRKAGSSMAWRNAFVCRHPEVAAGSAVPTWTSSPALQLDLHRRAVADGLVDHAIALGQLEQLIELVGRRVGIDIEAQPDLREADRRVLGDAERATEIEVAFGRNDARTKRDIERGRNRFERHAGASNQSLQQHVA